MGVDITGVGAVADLVGNAINKIWPDKTEQEKQQLATAVQVINGQLAINQAEAANPNLFVAGWRPGVGWVCVVALGYQYVARPLMMGFGVSDNMPALDESLWELLFGMLGLGSLRTFEKVKGVTK